MVQVCLVHMPYSDLEWPAIGLGLLKAYLAQRRISTKVLYGSLDFAAAVGLDVYRGVSVTAPESLLGEWTFAKAAFPDATHDERAYLAWIADRLPDERQFRNLRRLYGDEGSLQLLGAVRDLAPAFTDALARQVIALGPRIVGCTSTFQQHCASLALLRRIKELSPTTVTMIGGANCEGIMGETTHRQFPWLDFVMSGEVDAFFGRFCELILEKGPEAAARQAPEGVFGPLARSGSRYGLVPPRAVLRSLDEAAVPDFDDFFEALRASPLSELIFPGIVFESSRGCWWGEKHHCTFCGMNDEGLVFRSKTPARVVDEIMTLREKYGVRWLVAVDAILDVKHVNTVLPALAARDGRPYLFYEVKANLRRDQVRLLSRAGVRQVQPGIESLHDDVLKLLDKGNRWFINVQMLKWAQEAGISVNWNFLAGVPGERDEWYLELAEWLPAIYHLEPPGPDAVVVIRYDRYSVYHSRPDQYGLDLVPNRSYALVYPLPQEALTGLAYFFEDTRDGSTRPANGSAGHRAVSQRIVEWQQAFRGDEEHPPARLTARDSDGRLIVHDTRPIRAGETSTFDGLERAILKACESARTPRSLEASLRAEGCRDSSERIDARVRRLKDLHLLLEWQGHILSLHVNEPVTRYMTAAERPGVRVVRNRRPETRSRVREPQLS